MVRGHPGLDRLCAYSTVCTLQGEGVGRTDVGLDAPEWSVFSVASADTKVAPAVAQ